MTIPLTDPFMGSGQWAFVEGTHLVLTRFELMVSDPEYDGVTNRVLQVHCESFSSEIDKGFADDIARALQETREAQKQNTPTEGYIGLLFARHNTSRLYR